MGRYANAVPISQILSTLKMKATPFSEMSVLTWPTVRHIPENSVTWGKNP